MATERHLDLNTRLERRGPRHKRRTRSPGCGQECRFDFDWNRVRPVAGLQFSIEPIRKGRRAIGFTLEIDFYSQRGGWEIDCDGEKWEDEKIIATASPTREGYRLLYGFARALLNNRPMCDGTTTWLPLRYYLPQPH